MKLIEEQEVIQTLMDLDGCGRGDAEWLVSEMRETNVLQEIKQEIDKAYHLTISEDIKYAEGLERALIIIDSKISKNDGDAR